MKHQKIIIVVWLLVFLYCFPLVECQTDTSAYSPQEAEVTAADLFVASEAYCNLKKEIGKEMRKERNAISKLSKEEFAQYARLKKKMLNAETRTEAIAQLKGLTGYDYQTSCDRISALVKEVFNGTNFTKLELMRARQKSMMHKVSITRTETNEELREVCYKECDEKNKQEVIDCYDNFNKEISKLPPSEFPYGVRYKECIERRENCLFIASAQQIQCKYNCDQTYSD